MAWLADSQAIRGEKHKATRIEEAVTRGTLIEHLISDAGQMAVWPMKSCLQKADPLRFSHGFFIVFKERPGT